MKCKRCQAIVTTEEEDKVSDSFDDWADSYCFACAGEVFNEREQDQYMRSISYDVEVPFADNH